MSVRIEKANTEYLHRTATVFDYNGVYTIAGWVYVVSVSQNIDTICTLYGTHATDNAYDNTNIPWSSYATNRLRTNYAVPAGGNAGIGATNLSTGTWYYISQHRTSVSVTKQGIEAVTLDSGTLDNVTGRTACIQILLGAGRAENSGAAGDSGNMRLAYWRAWTGTMSDAELVTERTSATAVKTTNLWASWPLTSHTDLTDVSGNARHLTGVGTLSTEADPPAIIPPYVAPVLPYVYTEFKSAV